MKKSNYNLGYAGKWHLGTAETAADLNFEGFGPKGYGIVRESKEYNNYLKNLNISLPEATDLIRAAKLMPTPNKSPPSS